MRRLYPNQPLVGVGAIIICHGKILLQKRERAPDEGKWSVPGGLVELGESLGLAAFFIDHLDKKMNRPYRQLVAKGLRKCLRCSCGEFKKKATEKVRDKTSIASASLLKERQI